MDDRTEILLTVDVEFSIAGHFSQPDTYQPLSTPVVYCEAEGRQHGLPYLLETLNRFDLQATFFVECANYYYFGDEPMAGAVREIQAAGQDAQLHVHPVWLSFNNDPTLGTFPVNDDCDGRSLADLTRAFRLCTDVFTHWSGKPPHALRTGSLRADMTTYRAMAEVGIPVASNIALGVFQPPEPALQQHGGRHLIEGVLELPVFTYRDIDLPGFTHQKSLQITSCGWPEMKALLWQARKRGIRTIVILTHPFEYIKKSDYRYTRTTRNRVNKERLENLCRFIARHDQDFVARTFGSIDPADVRNAETAEPMIAQRGLYALHRKAQNLVNDRLWRY